MFKIKLIKNYPFKIKVYGYSKINSLIVNLSNKPYKIYAKLVAYLKDNTTMKSVSNIVIGKIKLMTNLTTVVKYKNSKIVTSIASKEKVSSTVKLRQSMVTAMRSKEKIKTIVKNKSVMLLSPVVGYFKKLYEFDSKNLSELDNISLEDMDYETKLMADSNE